METTKNQVEIPLVEDMGENNRRGMPDTLRFSYQIALDIPITESVDAETMQKARDMARYIICPSCGE